MKPHNKRRKTIVTEQLVEEFAADQKKGTVVFQEEAVFFDMIDLCEKNYNSSLAIRIADVAIQCHPFSFDLLMRKAELLLNCDMIAESIVTINAAELLAPNNLQLLLLKAELYIYQGESPYALSVLEEAKILAKEAEDKSEIYFLEACAFERLNDFESSYHALKRCLLANPKNNDGYGKALLLVELKGFYQEAEVLYNQLLDMDAYNWCAWMNLGYTLRGQEKNEEAIEAFEFAYTINEKCKEAYLEAGSLLVDMKEYHRAISVLEKALFDFGGDDALLLQQLGICYENLGQYESAIQFYSNSIEIDPNEAESFYHLGKCAAALKDWKQAIEWYQEAINLEDWREAFHAALAEAYCHNNQLPKAFFSYRKAASLARYDVNYWLQYILFLLKIEQPKMALRALQQAEKYVNDAEIEYLRVACLYQMGRRNEALYRLGEALQKDFKKHATLFKWRPDLANNAELRAIIDKFLR